MQSRIPVAAPNWAPAGPTMQYLSNQLRSLTARLTSAHPSSSPTCQMRFYKKPTHVLIAHRRKVPAYQATTYVLHTRLGSVAPEIAAEWDTEANPGNRYPAILSIGDIEMSAWKCKTCGTRFELSIEDRVMHGEGCPSCEADKMHRAPPRGTNNHDDDDLLPGERREGLSLRASKPLRSR